MWATCHRLARLRYTHRKSPYYVVVIASALYLFSSTLQLAGRTFLINSKPFAPLQRRLSLFPFSLSYFFFRREWFMCSIFIYVRQLENVEYHREAERRAMAWHGSERDNVQKTEPSKAWAKIVKGIKAKKWKFQDELCFMFKLNGSKSWRVPGMGKKSYCLIF